MDPSETLSAIVPEFRRLVNHPDWGSPPAEEEVCCVTPGDTPAHPRVYY